MVRVFLLLMILVVSAQPAVGAPRGGVIGIIDLAAVRQLHPDMRYHVTDFHLYLRPVEFSDPSEIAVEARRRDETMQAGVHLAEAEIDRLERRRLLIRRHLATIDEETEQARRDLKPEYARLYALSDPRERDEGLEKIKQELRAIDDAAALRKGTGENELERAEEAVRRARNDVFRINYLGAEEVRGLEAEIRDEIEQAMDRICRRQRIQTIFDVSALRPEPRVDAGKLVDQFWRTPSSHWSELFIISQEETDFSERKIPEEVIEDYRFRLRERLAVLSREKWPRLDQVLIRGGEDISAAVMDQLLESRGLDATRRKLTVEALNEYRSRKGKPE